MGTPLHRTFEAYADAWSAYDAARLAGFLRCPCWMASREGTLPLVSRAAIRTHLAALLAHHRRNDVGTARIRRLEAPVFGPETARATVHWEVRRSDGSPLWDFANRYHLVGRGEDWQIVVSTTL